MAVMPYLLVVSLRFAKFFLMMHNKCIEIFFYLKIVSLNIFFQVEIVLIDLYAYFSHGKYQLILLNINYSKNKSFFNGLLLRLERSFLLQL